MIALTLQISRGEGGLDVRLLKDGQEIASSGRVSDLSPDDLAAIRLELTEGANLTSQIPQFARLIGEKLLPPEVGLVWRRESDAAAGQRLITLIDATDDVQAYPWELAWSEGRLFLSGDRPFVRKARSGAASMQKAAWPIDMLIVLGSSTTELQKINGHDELRRIRRVLRERNRFVHVHVLDLSVPDEKQPDSTGRQRLVAALAAFKPQVLHFIGHGTETGLQLFQPAAKAEDPPIGHTLWTAGAIREDLENLKVSPWLVYLNACRSVGGGQQLPGQFSSLATAFLARGARAIIAMHANITGGSAATCAERFYRALAAGEPVDLALARARLDVDQSIPGGAPGVKEMPEAYLPVLLMACDPQDVLPCLTDPTPPPKTAQLRKGNQLTTIVQELVNRDAARRALLGFPHPGHPNAMVVHGPQSSGKSWLLAWCLDGWMRQGYTVRYRTMAGVKHWFDAMTAILAGDMALGPFWRPLQQAEQAFIYALGSLIVVEHDQKGVGIKGSQIAPKAKGANSVKWRIKPADRRRLDAEIVMVSQCFADALRQGTEKSPLVLALDEFEAPGVTAMNVVTFKSLYDNWLLPHVIDGDASVRVVMGLPRTLTDQYALPESMPEIALDGFPRAQYRELLEELLWARYPESYTRLHPHWEKIKSSYQTFTRMPSALSAECDATHIVLNVLAPGGDS